MVELRRLAIAFPDTNRGLGIAVRDVSLAVAEGERVAIVGESGSGKSLTALACLGLIPEPGRVVGGSILIEGRDLSTIPTADLERWRGGGAGFCFQEASSALNPVFTTGFQLEEAVRYHREVDRSSSRAVARDLLDVVAVDSVDRILDAYPHELSGGEAQRVMLALALAGDPRLLIADEPTSALDVVTRAEILELLDRLVEDFGLALLLVSHDLEVVRRIVERVAVMYAGEIVEEAPTNDVFGEPLHPYTQLLLDSAPGAGSRARRGARPAGSNHDRAGENGCAFTQRCPVAQPSCSRAHPELVEVAADRQLRCPVAADARGS